jgi:hypothetical protein
VYAESYFLATPTNNVTRYECYRTGGKTEMYALTSEARVVIQCLVGVTFLNRGKGLTELTWLQRGATCHVSLGTVKYTPHRDILLYKGWTK